MIFKNAFSKFCATRLSVVIILLSPLLANAQQRLQISDPDLAYIPLLYPADLQKLHEDTKSAIQAKKRVIVPGSPRIEYVTQRMAERRAMAAQNGIEESFAFLGFYDIDASHEENKEKLSFQPHLLSRDYLNDGSSSFLAASGNILKQVHYSTAFGDILIDEHNDTKTVLESPNLSILGNPATMHQAQYDDGEVVTIIYVAMEKRALVVEANSVTEDGIDEFLKMVESLVR